MALGEPAREEPSIVFEEYESPLECREEAVGTAVPVTEAGGMHPVEQIGVAGVEVNAGLIVAATVVVVASV